MSSSNYYRQVVVLFEELSKNCVTSLIYRYYSKKITKMMHYEEEGETLKDKSACAGVRADLKMCLLSSDCCKRVSITCKLAHVVMTGFVYF